MDIYSVLWELCFSCGYFREGVVEAKRLLMVVNIFSWVVIFRRAL